MTVQEIIELEIWRGQSSARHPKNTAAAILEALADHGYVVKEKY